MDFCTRYWALLIEYDNPLNGYLKKLAKDVWESDDEDIQPTCNVNQKVMSTKKYSQPKSNVKQKVMTTKK